MPEKRGKSMVMDIVKKIVSSAILDNLKSTAKDILKQAQKTAYLTEQKIMESVAAGVFLFIGIIFVAISLVMFINKSFNLEQQWGYLIMGLIIIIIALLFKQYINKTMFPRE
jgi:membrane protein insertase Oxa1/YidC/SpoIIIJ